MSTINPFEQQPQAASPAPQPQAASPAPQQQPQQQQFQQPVQQQFQQPAQNAGQLTTINPAANQLMVAAAQTGTQDVSEVSLEDDIKFNILEKFPKMKAGETARIAFLVFDDQGKPQLKRVDYFFDKALSEVWNLPNNPQLLAACVQKYGEPKIKFGTIVIRYETDMHGNMLPSGNYELLAYQFSRDKWPSFKSIHTNWGLGKHDLLLTCREAEFQKVDIQPAPQCLFRTNPQFAAEVLAKARALYDNSLPRMMGRTRTDAEIMAILNGQSPGQAAVPGAMPAGMPRNNAQFNPFQAGAGVGGAAGAPLNPAAPQQVPGANFADMVVTGTNAG